MSKNKCNFSGIYFESGIRFFTLQTLVISLIAAVWFIGCASSNSYVSRAKTGTTGDLEARWGVRLEGIRLTAQGHLVDFRYRVLDPERAVNLMKRGEEAYLLDLASGVKLKVPVTKVGQLRGTGIKPVTDRVYTVMFTSGGGVVQKGSIVTVVLGEFRAENLIVQ